MLVALLVVSIGFWPGHMNADTLIQIDQASDGTPITNHYAPILVWLWSLVWPLGVRPEVLLVLQTAGFLAGTYLILRAVLRPLAASVGAALIAFWPAVFGHLGLVGRDTWFLTLLVLSFGLLALALRRPGAPARWPLVLAAATMFLCLAARQNAVTSVVIAAIAAAFIALGPRLAGSRRLARIGVPVVAGTVVTLAAIGVQAGALALSNVTPVTPSQYLYAYDLGHLGLRDGEMLLPESVYPAQDPEPIAATLTLDSMIPMVAGPNPPVPLPVSDAQVAELRQAWIDRATGDPIGYLDHRTDVWLRQIAVTRSPHQIYHPGIDGNPFGYQIEFTRANDAVTGYQELFSDELVDGGLLHRTWIYLLAAAVTAVVMLRRGGVAALFGAIAVAAWTYQVGLFFGAAAVQYRYEFPAVTLAIIAFVASTALLIVNRARARSGAAVEASPTPAGGARTAGWPRAERA